MTTTTATKTINHINNLRNTGNTSERSNGWLPTPGLYAHISCGAVVVDRVCKTGKVRRDGITPLAHARVMLKQTPTTEYTKQWQAAVRSALDRYDDNRSDIDGESGSTTILALAGVASAGILGMIHWPLLVVALAAVLVYKSLDNGAPQGWYRLAPRYVRPSTPTQHAGNASTANDRVSYRTARDESPLALALLDACEGGNHVAPVAGTITAQGTNPEASELPVSRSWYGFDRSLGSTLVAEVGTTCAPDAQYPLAKVAALEAAINDGALDKLLGVVAYDRGGACCPVERNTPVWASVWITDLYTHEALVLVDVKVEQRRKSGRFSYGYQAVATVTDRGGNTTKHRL